MKSVGEMKVIKKGRLKAKEEEEQEQKQGEQEQEAEKLASQGGPQWPPLRIVARGAGEARGEEGPSPAQTHPGVTWR